MNIPRTLTALTVVAATSMIAPGADAATITASYQAGHRDVLINGYRTEAMGTFRLNDSGTDRLALCIEAHERHDASQDAYRRVDNSVVSSELDTLLWLIDREPTIDDDTALAAAALAWFYAGAQRTIGVPVWADGSRGFSPITPLIPEAWDALPPFSMTHMVGLRSGSTDLDGVERALAALHRRVVAQRGPWELRAIGDRFRLVGPASGIPDQLITVTVATPGAPVMTEVIGTDSDGWVTPVGERPVDGASVTATVDSPGVHVEWDGSGSIQRMSTSTSSALGASFEIDPLPRFVEVRKRSTDHTIGVSDGRFELLDGTGVVVGAATSNNEGIASFAAIDPAVAPGPYTVREIAAPPALSLTAPPVVIDAASHDPDHPTVVEMVDDPLRMPARVRKRLSMDRAGPSDRSGFAFSIVRRADGWADELVSGPDGHTDQVDLALGTYDVCERATPDWAANLRDRGCVEVTIGLGDLASGAPVTIDYVNVVPIPGIDTIATDPTDGDHEVVTPGGVIIDRVDLTHLVPGTAYVVTGELLARSDGRTLGVFATTEFVADASDATVIVRFDLPSLPAGEVVVVERVSIDGELVAEHVDLDDVDQVVTVTPFVDVATTTSTTTSTISTTTTDPPTSTTSTTTMPATTTTERPVVVAPPSTLPRTGSDAAGVLLRLGDIGFVTGVGLVALGGLVPRRRDVG